MTEQLSQVLLPIESWESENFSIVIAHPFSTQRSIWNDLTIQLTIVHSNQATRWGHSDRDYLPLGILKSDTDVLSKGSGRNIDNRIGVKLKGPIITIIPDTDSDSNCDIFDSVTRTSDISDRSVSWHIAIKS